ncbi:unnamed protein product, partial [Mesorhabditis spiculigera]
MLVVVDQRFTDALKSERFQNRAKVDKYGRTLKKSKNAVADEMAEMYEFEGKEEPEEEPAAKPPKAKKMKKTKEVDVEPIASSSGEEDSDVEEEKPLNLDLARGHCDILSSSGDSSDSEEEQLGELDGENWDELDKDARRVEWSSPRLAICNLDWDNLCSEDLFILCRSFAKDEKAVKSLTIYLSDFGQERLKAEETAGPQVVNVVDDQQQGRWSEADKKKRTNQAIRQYELDRLRYYYAVLVCDSAETATVIYEQCDGHEFENSGMRLDMRFVPDETEFDESRAKEQITGEQLNLEKYKPKDFISKASSNTTAEIAWDENNPSRVRKFKDAFDDGFDLDRAGKGLIASSEEESDFEEEGAPKRDDRINILMQAAGIEKGEKDMEIEWEPPEAHENSEESGDEESEADGSEGSGSEMEDEEEDGGKAPKKKKWLAYLERRRELRHERKQKAREEKESGRPVDEEEPILAKGKKAQKKPKITDDVVEKVASDPRFASLFSKSEFAIEKSSKNFKDRSLVDKQVAARKAQMADEDRRAKATAGADGSGLGSESRSLLDKLKKKTAVGGMKRGPPAL